ncbi:MAG: biotin-dependent carboxyltransferase family protein [Bacteroidota bacterium]
MMGIKILKSGLLTTIQDLGRYGYQRDGIIVGGAMDSLALRLGNLLLGNEEDEAGIEFTLLGGSLLFDSDQLVTVTGADLSLKIDAVPVPNWKPIIIKKGSILSFGRPVAGCRAYLCIKGGFDLEKVLGSHSTYLKAGFGGFNGRALHEGDEIPFRTVLKNESYKLNWGADLRLYPDLANHTIRYINGPDHDRFVQPIFKNPFKISNQADRMGYRLEGSQLRLTEPFELLSTAVTFGTVQVPSDGKPIVLMADRQTTGGYPIAAQVISADLPLLAQKKPGDELLFEETTVEAAQALLVSREKLIKQFKQTILLKYG